MKFTKTPRCPYCAEKISKKVLKMCNFIYSFTFCSACKKEYVIVPNDSKGYLTVTKETFDEYQR